MSEGGILLHKRVDAEHSTRIDQVDEDDLEDAGDQILRAFESRAILGEYESEDLLLDANIAVAGPLRLELHSSPKEPGRSFSARTQPSTREPIRSSR